MSWERFSSFIKPYLEFDHFGQNVNLTFRQKQKFKTAIGRVMSILYEIVFIILLYFVF